MSSGCMKKSDTAAARYIIYWEVFISGTVYERCTSIHVYLVWNEITKILYYFLLLIDYYLCDLVSNITGQ